MKKEVTRSDFLRVAGGASLAMVVSGCGFGVGQSNQGGGNQQADTVTLWEISTGAELELIKEVTRRFNEEHPNIRAEVQFFQNDPYKQKLRVAVGAGNPPDIFYGWGGGVLRNYVQAGKVHELTSEFDSEPWQNKFFPSVMQGVTFDGGIYGVPISDVQPVVFFYNKKLFENHGVSPPATWSELMAAIDRLKANNVIPISVGGQNNWTYLMYEEYLVDRIGGASVFNSVLQNEPEAWSDPAFIKANTMIQELVSAGAFEDGFNSVSYDTGQASALLYTDKAAMHLMGTWEFETILSSDPGLIEDGNLGWFPFPVVEGGAGDPKNIAGNLSNYYSVTNASGSKDAAIKYLKETALSEYVINERIKLGQVVPVTGIENKLEQAEYGEWMRFIYDLVQEAPHFQLSWDQALPPEPAQAFLENLDQLFLLNISPEQFSKNMNQHIETGE